MRQQHTQTQWAWQGIINKRDPKYKHIPRGKPVEKYNTNRKTDYMNK